MVLEGGLRDRMIVQSVTNAVVEHLDSLDWFDSGRQHLPLVVVDEFPDDRSEPAINTLAFSAELGTGDDTEMGSFAEAHMLTMFVDFFAESDALGRHVIGDVYAFLKKTRVIPIFDHSVPPPTTPEFFVEVSHDVEKRKSGRAVNAWQRHWYVCAFEVEDERANA